MSDKAFVDTSILVYAHDRSTGAKQRGPHSDRITLAVGTRGFQHASVARAMRHAAAKRQFSVADGRVRELSH